MKIELTKKDIEQAIKEYLFNKKGSLQYLGEIKFLGNVYDEHENELIAVIEIEV